MSRCRAMLEVSEEFIQAICFSSLDDLEQEAGPELQTRKSGEKGCLLVRCGREEGECNDSLGHLVWLFDQPCRAPFHSYLEEGEK